jgi:hypothetical protein
MSLPMLEALRLEIAQISLHLQIGDLAMGQIGYAGARQYPKANEFIELKANVTNLASKYIHVCFWRGLSDIFSMSYRFHT